MAVNPGCSTAFLGLRTLGLEALGALAVSAILKSGWLRKVGKGALLRLRAVTGVCRCM
jgi:hypothetical protein